MKNRIDSLINDLNQDKKLQKEASGSLTRGTWLMYCPGK